jgi:hypothetical protein
VCVHCFHGLHEVFTTGINAVIIGNYLTTLGTDPAFWNDAAARHGLKMAEGVTEIEGSSSGAWGSKDCH